MVQTRQEAFDLLAFDRTACHSIDERLGSGTTDEVVGARVQRQFLDGGKGAVARLKQEGGKAN